MVGIANINCIINQKVARRVDLLYYYHQKEMCLYDGMEGMEVLVNTTMVSILPWLVYYHHTLQHMNISNQHIAQLKIIPCYMSIISQ